MFSKFFIERPIFAIVVATLLTLAGAVSLTGLPVQQYPNITPVQVTVQATYPGADSRTVAESVAAPIETQINGVDNMLYMSSTSSSNGQMTLTVYFSLDTDPDIAQVQVQNRVNLAMPQLPSAVVQQGVNVQKKSSSIMMLVAVYAKDARYSPEYVANYANVYVLDALKRVPGAGQAQVLGVASQAMRIWMNPDRMASLQITTTDIQNAVAAQNALFGAGQIGQQPTAAPVELSFPVVTQRPFTDPKQYEKIILRASQDGASIVRVGDVARASIGLQQYIVDSRLNNAPATFIAVYQQAGANGLVVSAAVRKTLEDMKSRFPDGIEYAIALDTNDFVRLSIEEVIHTLIVAVILVVLVVYLFLQSLRTTFICAVAIVVALVTTFAGMLALGFSINLLTLFGLVLAIGMVVDDAIVVVENVERIMAKEHLDPKAATIKCMSEIGSSLVAVVLVMASVFVPAAFLPGTTGQLYKQFAITIVVSVSVSGFVALTLTPAMCGVLLRHSLAAAARAVRLVQPRGRPRHPGLRPRGGADDQAHGGRAGAARRVPLLDLSPLRDPADELRPERGPGLRVRPGHHARRGEPRSHDRRRRARGRDAREDPGRRAAHDDQRLQPARQRLQDERRNVLHHLPRLQGALRDARDREGGERAHDPDDALPGGAGDRGRDGVPGAAAADSRHRHHRRLRVLGPGHHRRRAGAAGRPDAGGDPEGGRAARARRTAHHVPLDHPAAPRRRRPRQGDAARRADRGRVQRHPGAVRLAGGEPVQPVQPGMVGDPAVGREVPADARGPDPALHADEQGLRPESGGPGARTRPPGPSPMVPLSALVTTSWVTGPDLLPHFNGFPAAKINGNAAPGYSSGQAIAAMEEVAREVLPQGYTFAWSGLAFEEKKSGGTSMIAFVFGLIIVFLVLAAQYESWTLPGAVMTAVPFGILGALTAIWLRGPARTTCTSRSACWC